MPEIRNVEAGIANIFLQHTSASLTINENCCPDVRKDMDNWLNQYVPENFQWEHTDEGKDDMPAHMKASIVGVSLNIPVSSGKLNLGRWQGIYLNEHRNHGGARRIVITVTGKMRE